MSKIASSVLYISFILLILYSTVYIFNGTPPLFTLRYGRGRNTNLMVILQWTNLFTWNDYLGTGYEPFKDCKYSKCYLTSDKNLMQINEFDAILFHSDNSHGSLLNSNWPALRKPHQKYVYVVQESPYTFRVEDKHTGDFYNWTMSYRSDSDIIWNYGGFQQRHSIGNITAPTVAQVRAKTKSIAWFVSNCEAPNKRQQLVYQIAERMSVDIYGKCGPLKCKTGDDSCYAMLDRDYKFYLSFENANCKDYVTEKLFNIMQRDVIPIVYGGIDYKKFAPPHSVIDVEDYNTVEELVEYLEYLSKNVTAYLEYFEYRKKYRVFGRDESTHNAACKLCEMLYTKSHFFSSYANIMEWWMSNKNAHCGGSYKFLTSSNNLS